jgi:hypothetical protein
MSLLEAEQQVIVIFILATEMLTISIIGLVVANRLTKDPLVSVMVLEAGGDGLGKCVIHA